MKAPWHTQGGWDRISISLCRATKRASDYVKSLPNSVARWFPRPPVALGTDGFGRSESRAALRRFFEVDAAMIAYAALADLARQGELEARVVRRARESLEIEDRGNPELDGG